MRENDTGLSTPRVPVLPEAPLSQDEIRHSERVRALIAATIDTAGGWIGFERFMDLALYAPGLGYYSAGTRKLGTGGDFLTAPELSPLFGACVARQCLQVLRTLAGGSILELGAGSGLMAADILARLESLDALPERYWILDVSGELRARQRTTLRARVPHLLGRVAWLDVPPAHPFSGVILANEVLDALPVARFQWDHSRCEELGVAVAGGEFRWSPRPAAEALASTCQALAAAAGGWDDGYISECCPRLLPWSRDVVKPLDRGAVLWFDYGLPRAHYYLPERHGGTLACHHRQRMNDDPFLRIGLQDITAWVDFTAVAEASGAAGCVLAGFTTQAFFLAALGIDREIHRLSGGGALPFSRLAQEARQLMLPGGMGERFKAMAWTRGLDIELDGFGLQDLRHSL